MPRLLLRLTFSPTCWPASQVQMSQSGFGSQIPVDPSSGLGSDPDDFRGFASNAFQPPQPPVADHPRPQPMGGQLLPKPRQPPCRPPYAHLFPPACDPRRQPQQRQQVQAGDHMRTPLNQAIPTSTEPPPAPKPIVRHPEDTPLYHPVLQSGGGDSPARATATPSPKPTTDQASAPPSTGKRGNER
jgi:hypothetical protein